MKERKSKKYNGIVAVLLLLIAVIIVGGGVYFRYFDLLDSRKGNLADDTELVNSNEIIDEVDSEEEYNPEQNISQEEVTEIEDKLVENTEKIQENPEEYETEAYNILLIGLDSRNDNFSGRSDVMILVSINRKTKKVLMTSILRDTYVSIPGCMDNRLNAAYVYGGSDLLVQTLKNNFGMDVDNCIAVNFFIVMDLVDYFGGIDIDLSSDEISVMNMYLTEINTLVGDAYGTDFLSTSLGGTTVHLNGKQALAYARVRYVGTDFARTGRQRIVIMKCLEKMKGMSLSDIDGFAREFFPKVRTDLTATDCASLLLMALSLSDYEFEQFTIPMEGTWTGVNIRGMSVLSIDFEKNIKAWRDKVQGQSEE